MTMKAPAGLEGSWTQRFCMLRAPLAKLLRFVLPIALLAGLALLVFVTGGSQFHGEHGPGEHGQSEQGQGAAHQRKGNKAKAPHTTPLEVQVLSLLKGSHFTKSPCLNMTAQRRDQLKAAYRRLVKLMHSSEADIDIMEEQSRRQSRLKEQCRLHPSPAVAKATNRKNSGAWRARYRNLMVSDRYRAIYCSVPKTGCANWKKVLKVLEGRDIWPGCTHLRHLADMRLLSSFNRSGIEHRLRTYYKFMFAREPMSRLVSAYLDKLGPAGTDPAFRRSHSRVMLRWLRSRGAASANTTGVSFAAFAAFIVATPTTFQHNEHWRRTHELCRPCDADVGGYDFLGHYGDLEQESNFVLRTIGAGDIVAYPQRQSFYTTTATAKRVAAYVQKLPSKLRKRLLGYYKSSYDLFGFKFGS